MTVMIFGTYLPGLKIADNQPAHHGSLPEGEEDGAGVERDLNSSVVFPEDGLQDGGRLLVKNERAFLRGLHFLGRVADELVRV